MSAQVRDMTKGSPAKLILLFAVPLMLGNIFQQLYTMVDTIVVGQVAGVQALAALGAVESVSYTHSQTARDKLGSQKGKSPDLQLRSQSVR